jgi:hypothetical protein
LSPVRLVIDPIDALAWARMNAGDTPEIAAARFVTLGGGRRPRPMRRASYRVMARLEPGGETALPAPIELVTVVNPAGYELFFDVVRTERGLRRSGLPPALYRFRADARQYQSADFDAELAGDDGAAGATRVELSPGDTYPFADGAADAPTVLTGALRAADDSAIVFGDASGTPRRVSLLAVQLDGSVLGQEVEVCAPYRLDQNGRWALLIDANKVSFDPDKADVELRVRDAGGNDLLVIPRVAIERGKILTLPQTRLEGNVRWSDGAPAVAVVTSTTFPGSARSRPDGEYVFNLPPELDRALDIPVTLAITAAPGVTTEVTIDHVTTRTTKRVPPVVLPRP